MPKVTGSNTMELKKINRRKFFHLLYQGTPLSKQDLSRQLGISIPTVNQYLKEMTDAGLIMTTGSFASTGGRKATAFTFNPDAVYSIGLEITAHHLTAILINLKGDIMEKTRRRLTFENSGHYFNTVAKELDEIIRRSGAAADKILGAGISLPALIAKDGRSVTFAPILNFTGGAAETFERYIPFPVRFINDANAACLAECWNAHKDEDIVYLMLSNSVGGAIYLNNEFYSGCHERSAEFGHMTLVQDGKPCYCGNRGCVDAYCNAAILSDSCDGNLPLFFELLDKGAQPQTALWKEYVKNLITAVNTLHAVFDCGVVLGGYVGEHLDKYLPELQALAAKANAFEKDGSYLTICRYRNEESAIGGALSFVQSFLDDI